MEPKTKERAMNMRRANRRIRRRRLDIPTDQVVYTNPDLLAKFTTETGKILPRRITGCSAKLHRRITREIKRSRAVNLLP